MMGAVLLIVAFMLLIVAFTEPGQGLRQCTSSKQSIKRWPVIMFVSANGIPKLDSSDYKYGTSVGHIMAAQQ
jgi:hypothetical protein